MEPLLPPPPPPPRALFFSSFVRRSAHLKNRGEYFRGIFAIAFTIHVRISTLIRQCISSESGTRAVTAFTAAKRVRCRSAPSPPSPNSKVMEEKEGLKKFESFSGKGLEVGGGWLSAQSSHDRHVWLLAITYGRRQTLSLPFFMR